MTYPSKGTEGSGSGKIKDIPFLTETDSKDSRVLRAFSSSEISAAG